MCLKIQEEAKENLNIKTDKSDNSNVQTNKIKVAFNSPWKAWRLSLHRFEHIHLNSFFLMIIDLGFKYKTQEKFFRLYFLNFFGALQNI